MTNNIFQLRVFSIAIFITIVNANLADITITGTVTNHTFSHGVFIGNYSWFQANNICSRVGYGRLDDSQPGQIKLNAVTQFLRENAPPSSMATFWVGHFRPYPQIFSWYQSKGCNNAIWVNKNLQVFAQDEQCAAVHYENTSGFNYPTFVARNCESELSFLCYKYHGNKQMITYEGYTFLQQEEKFESIFYNNVTKQYCEDECSSNLQCPLYTFNHETNDCMVRKIFDGYGKVEYNLTFTDENITQGVKAGIYNVSYEVIDANVTSTEVNKTFPECNVSPIPDNYCPCGIPEEDFDHLIQEMTVDPESTSKSQSRYESAEDNRPSSKFLGGVGIVIIVTVISLIVISDTSRLFMKTTNVKKGTQTKNQVKQ